LNNEVLEQLTTAAEERLEVSTLRASSASSCDGFGSADYPNLG
jgi:hypothetical protein